ncbi:multidrug effflux MFS transporter [Paenochrobactrum sp. BZR 588]|uniref:multidrug effflux MFS transporter n=1 Tax=unclassified Paenochrobactrum TaxID=2639760 RepID=UPI003851875A
MKRNLTIPLATGLMMFPQIAETIYSPALPQIAQNFSVSPEQAGQTLSFYFLAFAIGVVVWGRLCDSLGRRPTMLLGLFIYTIASLLTLVSLNFEILMAARMLAAFGAAVGSVATQTMMRDMFDGAKLAQVFSIMGIALAVSPAIGMMAGSVLTSNFGYQGMFTGLAALALLLLLWSAVQLPETQTTRSEPAPFFETLAMMMRDRSIWRTACLVALFNLALFGYYQLAPFNFERLHLSPEMFGYSGLLLAFGVLLGSLLNQRLLKRNWSCENLVILAASLMLVGGALTTLLQASWLFVLPVMLVVLAYGLAIPNILAKALVAYGDRRGTAGAVLGLFYYVLLGFGLVFAGWWQQLGALLLICGIFAMPIAVAVQKVRPQD